MSATSTLGRSTGGPGGRDSARRLRVRRAGAIAALGGVALSIGLIVGASHSSSSGALAGDFAAAWQRGDYAAMYAQIDAPAQRDISIEEFASAYEGALRTATATHVRVTGHPREQRGGVVVVPVDVYTRLFGRLALSYRLKIENGGEGPRVAWSRSLVFPGLLPGERLVRESNLPRRATLLARDGSVLAESPPSSGTGGAQEGSARISPLGEAATAVVGEVGPVPASRRAALGEQGVSPTASVGVSGLELAFDEQLRGTPGGELIGRGTQPGSAERVLAAATPRPAPALRTTVSPAVQRAAVTALGGQLGGIVALVPATGQILAVAGIGLTSLQPPGSTFKMVTVTGVLAAGLANPHTVFPYATYATLDGVRLNNANGEECGGTLELAFAVSCNSVFAPLGVRLGAARLVATAERFGFNQQPTIPGAATSTIPPAGQIQGELDVGSTAIGQGQVLASALQMAIVAATVGDDGSRPQPTFTPSATPAARVPAVSPAVARTVRHLMIGVVREGTGTSAAIPGVTVAGKTGTAELKTTTSCAPQGEGGAHQTSGEAAQEGCSASNEASNTDAWFAAFAPALHPRIAVGVLLVKDGAGGDTAAPVAREVLEAGLQAAQ